MTWIPDRALDRLRETASLPDLSETRYRLVGTLGRGGMGTVYRAQDTRLDREIALKVLDAPDPTGDLAARLSQEARVLARLEHPGIVPVHDVGKLGDGRIFYTMKRVRGDRLDDPAIRTAPLRDRLRIFVRICEAVAFAHAQSVLHRDLKPANIMVGAFGEVLVMDWGLAKVLAEAETPATAGPDAPTLVNESSHPGTRHGAVLGTPGFMAPEQARGDIASQDERTDVFALGAVLGFLVTPPPGNPTAPGPVAPAAGPGSHGPAALRAIVQKAMGTESRDRYPAVLDLAAEVDRYLDGKPVHAHPESPLVRAGRFLWRHRVAVLLLMAYALVRALTILLRDR